MTSCAPPVTLIAVSDRQAALAAWERALATDDVIAVLDASWPGGQRAAAEQAVRAARERGALAPRDLVLFTSGSSGLPRAVHRSRASWEYSAAAFAGAIGLVPGDVVAVPGPLSSTMFSFAAWHALECQAVPVAADLGAGRDGERGTGPAVTGGALADAAASPPAPAAPPASPPVPFPGEAGGIPPAREAGIIHVVPAMLPVLFAQVRAGEWPRLRTVVAAGDVVPGEAWATAGELGLRLIEYYGAAELSLVGIREAPGPLAPFPAVQAGVRDGWLWSRSPFHIKGYLGDPGPLRTGSDGWACAGDLAQEVPGGFIVRGRGGAAITTGGHTVVAEEVERFLRSVPGVRDAGVTGVPHPRLRMRLVAVVDADVTDEELRRAVRQLPAPSRPRAWIRALVPRTAGGKILRAQLAGQAAGALAARAGPAVTAVTPAPEAGAPRLAEVLP